MSFSEYRNSDQNESAEIKEKIERSNRETEFNSDDFKPGSLERAIDFELGGFQDAIPLGTNLHDNTDVYSANNDAYIDGRTNKYQDFDRNEEYGNRGIRIQPGFEARGDNDDSGLINRGGTRQYYTGVDKDTGIITVYRASSTGNDDPMGYYTKDGVFHPLEGRDGQTFATDTEIAYFNGEEVIDRNGNVIRNGDEFVINEALKQAEDEYRRDLANGDAPPPDIGPYELYTGIPYEDSAAFKLEEEAGIQLTDVLNGGGIDMNAREK